MARDYSTMDAYLAKKNLFYDWCNEVAQSIYDEYKESDGKKDADEFFCDEYDCIMMSLMEVEAEDYINSYGIMRALKEYGCEPESAVQMIAVVAHDEIRGRFNGLCENARYKTDRSRSGL